MKDTLEIQKFLLIIDTLNSQFHYVFIYIDLLVNLSTVVSTCQNIINNNNLLDSNSDFIFIIASLKMKVNVYALNSFTITK